MIYIGNHLSSSRGFLAMGKMASKLDGDTFAFFTRNPRGGAAKAIVKGDADALNDYIRDNNFGKLVAHAPYTMNVCAEKENVRTFGWNVLKEDLDRMQFVPGNYYNFHPGSHVKQGAEVAIPIIADAINNALREEHETTILLETMAGKGTEVGRTFEEIKAIINLVKLNHKVGVCFDTCHVWDAGYNIKDDLDGVLKEFDEVIGLDRLKAIHFNDSMNECGSHKDRHAKIGEGKIGLEGMKRVVQHPLLQGKPFILETPNDNEGYKQEIELIREWIN